MVRTRRVTPGSLGSGECHFERGVVIIDLEEDALAVDIEERHIVLAVRVVVRREVVEGANGRDRALEEGVAARGDAARDDELAIDDEAQDWVGARAQARR